MKKLSILLIFLYAAVFLFTGCGRKESGFYSIYEQEDLETLTPGSPVETRLKSMSEDVAVIDGRRSFDPNYITATFAGVFSEAGNGEVIYEKNAVKRMYPASLTKCMTALLVLENCPDLEVTVKTGDISLYGLGESASSANLQSFTKYTVKELLTGLLVPSGNDAALVLSEYISGTTEAFVALMNGRAKELGMVGTHFENPHGLFNSNHYTTAYDLYLLVHECLKHEEFVEIAGKAEASVHPVFEDGSRGEQHYVSANSYLKGYTVPPDGMSVIATKTGYTASSGRCLIVCSEYAGVRYISIIGHAASYDLVYEEMNKLLKLTER